MSSAPRRSRRSNSICCSPTSGLCRISESNSSVPGRNRPNSVASRTPHRPVAGQFCRGSALRAHWARAGGRRCGAVGGRRQLRQRALLQTRAGADEIVALADLKPQVGTHDYWTYLLSLPLHAHSDLSNIPAAVPYLFADPARVAAHSAQRAGASGRRAARSVLDPAAVFQNRLAVAAHAQRQPVLSQNATLPPAAVRRLGNAGRRADRRLARLQRCGRGA